MMNISKGFTVYFSRWLIRELIYCNAQKIKCFKNFKPLTLPFSVKCEIKVTAQRCLEREIMYIPICLPSLKKLFEGHKSFGGRATDTPVFDFWIHCLRAFLPEVILRCNSGATPTDCTEVFHESRFNFFLDSIA